MKLISKGMRYTIMFDEEEGAEGWYFIGNEFDGGVFMNAEQAYLNTGIMPDDEPSGGEIPEEVRAFALRMLQHFKSEMKSAGYLH